MFATDKNDNISTMASKHVWPILEGTVKTASVKCIIDSQCGDILLWLWWPAADTSACKELITGVSDCVSQHAAAEAGLPWRLRNIICNWDAA